MTVLTWNPSITEVYLAGFIILFVGAVYLFFKLLKAVPNEYDRKLNESLKEDYIYDPETGAKLTLEQAESGHWVAHSNDERIIPEEELEQYFSEEAADIQRLINDMKRAGFKKFRLNDELIDTLESLAMLGKYQDWSCPDCFSYEGKFFVLFTQVQFNVSAGRHIETALLNELFFWVPDAGSSGHYFFREKKTSEKIFDLLRTDDELKLEDYECFTINQGNHISNNRLLQFFSGEPRLEIEFFGGHVFIKNEVSANKADFERMLNITKQILPV